MVTHAVTTVVHRHSPAIPIPPDAPVIPAWRLVAGANPDKQPRYSDRSWSLDFGIAAANVPSSNRRMAYADYPETVRDLVWAYSWTAMNLDHFALPTRVAAVAPTGVKREARGLVRYCAFMNSRGVELRDVSDADNDAWMAQFRKLDYSSRVRAASIPKRIFFYRHYLPVEVSDREPWADREACEVLGKPLRLDENTTHRIPRAILEPMFKWAMFYLEHAYDDILDMYRNSLSRGSPTIRPGAHVPGTNIPWRELKRGHDEPALLEVHFLVTAAYIVTAYLSGMRDGEVQAIKRKSCRIKHDADGVPYRYLVESTEYKNSDDADGDVRTWVVLPEVHFTLQRLEALCDVMKELSPDPPHRRGTNYLFRRFGGIRSDYASLQQNIVPWLNEFQRHVNELAADALRRAQAKADRDVVANLFTIPLTVEGEYWRWKTKQLRRTIAWYIANEPFGIVAGMRQFGHVREVTFQGYAGTPEAGFRDEIELARHVGKMRDIIEIYEDVKAGMTLGGAKGRALEGEFRAIAERLGDLPGKVVDDQRLLGMLKNVAKEVYPGILNDCFFDPDTAICLKKWDHLDRTRPHFAQCDWEGCPNSAWWSKHRAALQRSLEEASEHRRRPRLSRNQRGALDVVIAKYRSALARIGHAGQR